MISFKFLNPDLTFRIGKHNEKHISEVDRFYLEWCVKEGREKMKPIEVEIFNSFIKFKKEYSKAMEEKEKETSIATGSPGGEQAPIGWPPVNEVEALPF